MKATRILTTVLIGMVALVGVVLLVGLPAGSGAAPALPQAPLATPRRSSQLAKRLVSSDNLAKS